MNCLGGGGVEVSLSELDISRGFFRTPFSSRTFRALLLEEDVTSNLHIPWHVGGLQVWIHETDIHATCMLQSHAQRKV